MTFEEAWRHIEGIRGWLGNKDQARWMWVEAARARHVIEIGTYCGKSAILMAMAMADAGNADGRVYCVDTFTAQNEELQAEDTEDEFHRNVAAAGVDRWIYTFRGNSKSERLRDFVPRAASLLYIDADHRYEAVLEDIRLWHKHVAATDGQILFHDYDWPDVRRAIEDAARRGWIRNVRPIAPDAASAKRGCGCGS